MPFSSARKWSALALDTPMRHLRARRARVLRPQRRDRADARRRRRLGRPGPARAPASPTCPTLAPCTTTKTSRALPPGPQPLGLRLPQRRAAARGGERRCSGFAEAGITLKIISGDNPDTVAALATPGGLRRRLPQSSRASTSTAMDDAQFAAAAQTKRRSSGGSRRSRRSGWCKRCAAAGTTWP